MSNVTFIFPANTNHVLKEEARSIAEVAASGNLRYSDPDTHLDPGATKAILSWLRGVLA